MIISNNFSYQANIFNRNFKQNKTSFNGAGNYIDKFEKLLDLGKNEYTFYEFWKYAHPMDISQKLRYEKDLSNFEKSTVDKISEFFKFALPSKFDAIQYRSETYSTYAGNIARFEKLKNARPGDIIEDKGYCWSTNSQEFTDNFMDNISYAKNVSYTYLVPKNSKLLNVGKCGDQYDFIFDKGAKFKVLSIDNSDENNIKLVCEYIQE